MLGKNQIYLERNTFHRQSVGHLRRQEASKYGVVSFVFFNVNLFICLFIYFWLHWVFVAARGLSQLQ